MKNVAFCTATAGDRFDQAFVAMKSVKIQHPDARLFCDALDFTNDQITALENIGVSVRAFSTSDILPDIFDIEILNSHADNHEKEKGYRAFEGISLLCASWRLYMIPRIMEENDCVVVWMDSDCIVKKNLTKFIENASNVDLSIHFRPGNPDQSKVLSSVFAVNNTEGGKRFCGLLGPSYQSVYKKVDWWADPYSLFCARRDFGGSDWNFPAKIYNDSRLHDDAVIWHAKHSGIDKPKWKASCKKVRRTELDGDWKKL